MLRELTIVYCEGRRELNNFYIAARLVAALRFLFFPKTLFQFYSMKITNKLRNPAMPHDPLYFLVHTYYLSKRFTLRQRLQCAMDHHEYERMTYSYEYARRVYRTDGIMLWNRSVDRLIAVLCG